MSRSHRSDAVGVVFLLFGSENHPVRSKKGGFATSFLMSRPPLLAVMQGGESPASPFFVVERGSKNCFVVQLPSFSKEGSFAFSKSGVGHDQHSPFTSYPVQIVRTWLLRVYSPIPRSCR